MPATGPNTQRKHTSWRLVHKHTTYKSKPKNIQVKPTSYNFENAEVEYTIRHVLYPFLDYILVNILLLDANKYNTHKT